MRAGGTRGATSPARWERRRGGRRWARRRARSPARRVRARDRAPVLGRARRSCGWHAVRGGAARPGPRRRRRGRRRDRGGRGRRRHRDGLRGGCLGHDDLRRSGRGDHAAAARAGRGRVRRLEEQRGRRRAGSVRGRGVGLVLGRRVRGLRDELLDGLLGRHRHGPCRGGRGATDGAADGVRPSSANTSSTGAAGAAEAASGAAAAEASAAGAGSAAAAFAARLRVARLGAAPSAAVAVVARRVRVARGRASRPSARPPARRRHRGWVRRQVRRRRSCPRPAAGCRRVLRPCGSRGGGAASPPRRAPRRARPRAGCRLRRWE